METGRLSPEDFSLFNRKKIIAEAAATNWDLVIIGGGITGAGIALDAASRGIKTLLLEKNDFAFGTSSRSSKLIHGGLRYLKNFEFGLVREVGSERAIVYRNARHLVRPEKMFVPVVRNGALGKSALWLALWIYDYLAKVRKEDRKTMLTKEEAVKAEPLFDTQSLLGGGLYTEYRTDDARLVLAVISTAIQKGAYPFNYFNVVGFEKENDLISAVKAKDELSGEVLKFSAKVVVNAAGPWVDAVRKSDGDQLKKRLVLTKGIHFVVTKERFPIRQAVYFDMPDKRMVFAIPRDGKTYIGTTDTFFKDKPDAPDVLREDVNYLLEGLNRRFPGLNLQSEEIESAWSGLRPLVDNQGGSPSELSRKDEIFISPSGLVSIAGGKLTGYRLMAAKVVDKVAGILKGFSNKGCVTENLVLNGGEFDSEQELEQFAAQRMGYCSQIGITGPKILQWVFRYGRKADLLIEKAFEFFPQEKNPNKLAFRTEVWFGIHQEMVTSLCDFLIRRTGMLYFQRQELEEALPFVRQMFMDLGGFSEMEMDKQEAELLQQIELLDRFRK